MKTLLLEGDVTGADSFTSLTTRGSEASPSLQLPAAWSKIHRVIASVAVDFVAAGSAICILRLAGPAVMGGEDIIIAGMGGQNPQTGADPDAIVGMIFNLPDADIDVSGGDVINVQAAMTDTDLGTANVCVSLYGQ